MSQKSIMELVKPGDIILYGGTGFISRTIQYFMKKKRVKIGVIINIWNQLYTVESNKNIINIFPFYEKHKGGLDIVKILSPKKSYSKDEQELISITATEYFLKPKIDRKKFSFIEAVITWINKVRPHTFAHEEVVNPSDIELNRYYKTIYDGSDIE